VRVGAYLGFLRQVQLFLDLGDQVITVEDATVSKDCELFECRMVHHAPTRVVQLVNHFDSGQVGIIVEVSDTLQEWLVQHILRSDAAYARFFQSIGVANDGSLQQLNADCSEVALDDVHDRMPVLFPR
jgi:hypothetical protein